MELALFTPGAYIWPVHRNLEAFVASLAAPVCDAPSLSSSKLYPARLRTDSSVHGLSAQLDERLQRLHRELYSALLRPVEYFAGETRNFVEYFIPDLRGSALEQLCSAFTYFFVEQTAAELSVVQGLSVIRTVFLNHEASEPDLWLHGARARLSEVSANHPRCSCEFAAPQNARLNGLAFALNSATDRSPRGPGWISGQVSRNPQGQLVVAAVCGYDPSLATAEAQSAAQPQISAEMKSSICRVFGWDEELAA